MCSELRMYVYNTAVYVSSYNYSVTSNYYFLLQYHQKYYENACTMEWNGECIEVLKASYYIVDNTLCTSH